MLGVTSRVPSETASRDAAGEAALTERARSAAAWRNSATAPPVESVATYALDRTALSHEASAIALAAASIRMWTRMALSRLGRTHERRGRGGPFAHTRPRRAQPAAAGQRRVSPWRCA